jgi:uncharacterized protein YoxC
MNDTWAAVLAISVAVMALVQLVYLIVLGLAARRIMAVVEKTQAQVESLASYVEVRVAGVTETVNGVTARVNAVADDVKGVTARVQEVARTFSDGVQRMEQTVRAAGQKVVETVDQVPAPVKKGVPAGLAILAALRTVQQIRQRLRADRARRAYSDDDMYASMHG